MKHRPRHVAEYVVFRMITSSLSVLPYRASLAMAWLSARLVFLIFRPRVREARRRISSVFGDRFSPGEVRDIAWKSLRNIIFSGVEMVRAPRLNKDQIDALFDYGKTMDVLKAHCDTGEGTLLALPHMGSWEMAAKAYRLNGLPIFSIGAEQKNELMNAYIGRLRSELATDTVNRGPGTPRDVLRRLKDGKLLAILSDVRVRFNGVPVPFLGGTANIGKGLAAFAIHANVPIFPGTITREGWFGHRMSIWDPVWPDKSLDKEEDVRRITCSVLGIFEKEIRRDPSQWFWYNKRWILDPVSPMSRPGPWTQAKGKRKDT